jgi:hypothetical protein
VVNLDDISISYPCPANWNAMEGDERVRFCSQCKLNVYNISEMSKNDAERLISEKEGEAQLCIRLYRRPDGSVITDNCPVGLKKFRAQVRANFTALAIWVFGIAFVSWVGLQLHPVRYTIISGGMGSPMPLPLKPGFAVLSASFLATQLALTAVSLHKSWTKQWFWATVVTFFAGLAFGGLASMGILFDPIYFITFMLPYGILFAMSSLLTTLLVLNRSHLDQLKNYFEFRQKLGSCSLPMIVE